MSDDIFDLNRRAWDTQADRGNRWTVPVSIDEVEAARNGDWKILLTPTRPVPRDWFPTEMKGTRVLCLASGGGQQGPILAAAGATVTVYDGSPKQLERDREVAEREGLELETVEGDMADLQKLGDESFDLVVHPVSNAFVPDVHPVWSECARVLRDGGELLAGFTNPIRYLFADDLENGSDQLCATHRIPYSDVEALSDGQKARQIAAGEPFEFSHTLADQIAGQILAGFVLCGFYEDAYPAEEDALSSFIPSFIATRARKERP